MLGILEDNLSTNIDNIIQRFLYTLVIYQTKL